MVMTDDEALDIASEFLIALRSGDESQIRQYTKKQIKCALSWISPRFVSRLWYKEMERRIGKIEKEEASKESKEIIKTLKDAIATFKKSSAAMKRQQVSGRVFRGKIQAPNLTEDEKKVYGKKCERKDLICFLDQPVDQRSYNVSVNEHVFSLEYIPFALLLYLADALKKRDGGWVSKKEIYDKEKIVLDEKDVDRVICKLRKALRPFIEHNNMGIIQSLKRHGQYRLTTMPTRIRAPHKKWVSSKYKCIKAEIRQEKVGRVGENNV